MTHTRYWSASLATALCAGFIVVVRFAFDSSSTPWIVFGVAIAASVFSFVAFMVALLRDGHAFSGFSAVNVMIAAWTIIAMLTLNDQAAGWVAFADGIAMLAIALRALALHEASIERIVYPLQRSTQARPDSSPGSSTALAPKMGVQARVSRRMRSWISWLTNTAIAITGGFIVVMTFALTRPGTNHVSPRWVAFGLAIAAATVAIGALFERAIPERTGRSADWTSEGREGLLAVATANLAASVALIVTMIIYAGSSARWLAFALGCAMVGVSLLGLVVHEITTERVRHELALDEPMSSPSSVSGEVGAR